MVCFGILGLGDFAALGGFELCCFAFDFCCFGLLIVDFLVVWFFLFLGFVLRVRFVVGSADWFGCLLCRV